MRAGGIRHAQDSPRRRRRPEIGPLDLDQLCRLAAREMLALEAERRAHLDTHAALLDESGRRLVVGNGFAQRR